MSPRFQNINHPLPGSTMGESIVVTIAALGGLLLLGSAAVLLWPYWRAMN